MTKKKFKKYFEKEYPQLAKESIDENYSIYIPIPSKDSFSVSDGLNKLKEFEAKEKTDINPNYINEIVSTVNQLIEHDKYNTAVLHRHEKIITKFKSEMDAIAKCNSKIIDTSSKVKLLSETLKQIQNITDTHTDSLNAILVFVQRCADRSGIPFHNKWKLSKLLHKIHKYIKKHNNKVEQVQLDSHNFIERKK